MPEKNSLVLSPMEKEKLRRIDRKSNNKKKKQRTPEFYMKTKTFSEVLQQNLIQDNMFVWVHLISSFCVWASAFSTRAAIWLIRMKHCVCNQRQKAFAHTTAIYLNVLNKPMTHVSADYNNNNNAWYNSYFHEVSLHFFWNLSRREHPMSASLHRTGRKNTSYNSARVLAINAKQVMAKLLETSGRITSYSDKKLSNWQNGIFLISRRSYQ